MVGASKVAVLFAVAALCGVLALPAVAANWHTSGPTPFSTTDAGATRVVFHPASGTAVIYSCPTFSASGTLNGPTSAALPWLSAATVTPVFGAGGNCTVSGVPGYTVACGTAELRANSYAGGDTFATAGGGVTTGAITGIDCCVVGGREPRARLSPARLRRTTSIRAHDHGAGRITITTAGAVADCVEDRRRLRIDPAQHRSLSAVSRARASVTWRTTWMGPTRRTSTGALELGRAGRQGGR